MDSASVFSTHTALMYTVGQSNKLTPDNCPKMCEYDLYLAISLAIPKCKFGVVHVHGY